MRLADFDFELPEDRIALRPASPRDAARLLVVDADGALRDRNVRDLPSLLAPGDALVFNDTRVIAARLKGVRARDGSAVAVEATLLEAPLVLALDGASPSPAGGWRSATGSRSASATDRACLLADLSTPTVVAKGEGGEVTLAFDLAGPDLDLAIAERTARCRCRPTSPAAGPRTTQDLTDYQTVYAREDGSVAAPTAGPALHARAAGGAEGARRLAALRHPARRRRHLPAGEDRGRRRPPHARRVRRGVARRPPPR